MSAHPGYYRHPTLHGDHVVFVCEDDLWTVSANGGTARRLTANPGRATFPRFSPDGSQIAFTGQDDGPTEIYVMDAAGGDPRRVTWLGCITQTVGWTTDGRSVLLASDWRRQKMGYAHLHAVPASGGAPRELGHGPARAISYQPGGAGVVVGRNSGDPARWKRYRGGTAGTLWVDRRGDGEFSPLVKLAGNLASPMWIGTRIYFLSDHEGHGNLYSCTPTGRGLKRHTHHEDFYVRFPSTDGRRIVYHAGADLYVFDARANETRGIPVDIQSSRPERNRRFVPAAPGLEGWDLHPAGARFAATTRGGAFTSGLWDGAVQRHGAPSKERHRLASWLPGGTSLLSVADLGGEECLVVHPAATAGRRKIVRADFGRAVTLRVAPAGAKRVAIINHRLEVVIVDLETRARTVVDRSEWDRPSGLSWSPDGRYLAYGVPTSPMTSRIRVHDTRGGRTHDVTNGDFRDGMPAFDPEGRYLYFLSGRVFDPVYDGHYFDVGFPRGMRPYLVTLQKGLTSPFDAATREPRVPEGTPPPEGGPDAKGKTDGKGKAARSTIDFPGIQDRVLPFPVPEGLYGRILGTKERALFTNLPVEGSLSLDWAGLGVPAAKATLEAWDFNLARKETVHGGITDFTLSADGRVLGVRVGNRLRAIPAGVKAEALPKGEAPGAESGWIDLGRLRVEVHPGAEWAQMFREAWRLQRDQFWTPDMCGVDWTAVHDRYLPLVNRAATRSEFSDLMWEMQGELGTSHCYEMGGDYRPVPAWHQGFLGADLAFRSRRDAWVVERLPQGDSWEAQACSPLVAPGLDVRQGDEIVAVDGIRVGRQRTPYECLVHRSGQAVQLTVRRGKGRPRNVTVTALPTEFPLRYRDWVETNRALVHRKTRGKVGYVHIPDMGPSGFAEFHRYFRVEVEKPGLIVDVRFNGGGHVSQLLLQKLLRKRVAYDRSRWQGPFSYPMSAPWGPMVALTNEYAGSDGDIFSHGFKLYGLGPLIGKRTWGGVVGIWPRHALVDGSVTTQPEFSSWFVDVGYGVENYGTDPDIEVEIRPQDHAAGRDPQMESALQEIGKLLAKQKPTLPKMQPFPDLRPPDLPPANGR